MKPEDVPAALMSLGRNALIDHDRAVRLPNLPTYEERVRAVLAAVLPKHEKRLRAERDALKRGGAELGSVVEKLADVMRTTVMNGVVDPYGVLVDLADWLTEAEAMTAEEHGPVVAALKHEAQLQRQSVTDRDALKAELELLKLAAKTVTGNDWYGRLARAEAAIERVRELHSPETDPRRTRDCKGCRTSATLTLFENCRTLAALDAPHTPVDAPKEENDRD